jgi:hypothetical protein
MGERIGDFIDQGLEDFMHFLLGDFKSLGTELIGDFNDEFAFGDGGQGDRESVGD